MEISRCTLVGNNATIEVVLRHSNRMIRNRVVLGNLHNCVSRRKHRREDGRHTCTNHSRIFSRHSAFIPVSGENRSLGPMMYFCSSVKRLLTLWANSSVFTKLITRIRAETCTACDQNSLLLIRMQTLKVWPPHLLNTNSNHHFIWYAASLQ